MIDDNLLIDGIIAREGTRYTEPPENDQPTAIGGITAGALAYDRSVPASAITPDVLKALTLAEAREIIRRILQRLETGAGLNRLTFDPLRLQLIDFAYESGPARAVRWLQRVAGLPDVQVTGILDDRTLAAVQALPPALVNNALAASRAHAAQHGGVQDPHLVPGVVKRCIDFVIDLAG